MIGMIFPRIVYVFLPVAQALLNVIGLTALALALVCSGREDRARPVAC